MKTKQLLTVISAAALMFTSCSMFNNDSKTQEVSEDTTSSLVTLDHIYDGADELLGKAVGQSFILPEKIHKWEPECLYKLHTSVTYSDDKEFNYGNLARTVRVLTGSEPEERYLTYSEEYKSWKYDAPGLYAAASKTGAHARLSDPDAVPVTRTEYPTEDDITRESFDIQKGEDGGIVTSSGEYKASELAERACRQFLDKLNELGAPLTAVPSTVDTQMAPKFGIESINVSFHTLYKGIPFCINGGSEYPVKGDSGHREVLPTVMNPHRLYLSEDRFLGNIQYCSANVTEREEITKIIPFTKAVELLKSVFADYSNVEIIYAELNYCAPRTLKPVYPQPDNGTDPEWEAYHKSEAETGHDWEPCWCFYFDSLRQGMPRDCFRVNAVTGDVTADLYQAVEM